MTRSNKRVVAILIIVIALIASVGFVLFILTAPDPAADAPRAQVGEARTSAAASTLPATRSVDAVILPFASTGEGGGTAELQFTGSSALGEQPGFFESFAGAATLDAEGKLKSIAGTVDVASVLTNADSLTGKLKNEADFFDVAKHPTASFASTAIAPAPADVAGATHLILGDLTLRGVTRAITFPAKVTISAEALELTSEFAVNRRDFGITYDGGTAFPEIRDLVRINLNITAPRPASSDKVAQ